MNKNKLPDYLGHIQQAAIDACGFIKGLTKDEFFTDRRTQNAVVMSLIVLGETSAKVMDLYSDFAVRHAGVPWRKMRGMRNRITHGYFEVDFEMVWDTVTTALPELLEQLPSVCEDADDENRNNNGMEPCKGHP